MKTLKTLLLGTIVLTTMAAKAQTAAEIVDKYVAALGGKEKVASIKSIYIENSIQIMGTEAPSSTYILNGKGFKNEMDMNGQKIVQCMTTTGGWSINPFQGQTGAEAMPADAVRRGKAQLDIGGPLFNYTAKGNKVELLGKEDVNTIKNAYKLKLTTQDTIVMTYYIDPASYYLVKTVTSVSAQGQDMEISTTYSDYKKTDYGFAIPYTTELTLPQGMVLTMNTKKVEINKAIDPTIFDMPK